MPGGRDLSALRLLFSRTFLRSISDGSTLEEACLHRTSTLKGTELLQAKVRLDSRSGEVGQVDG
jgi:hypothetical protein